MKYDEAVALAERSRERIRLHEEKAVELEAQGGNQSLTSAAIMRDCASVASIALMRAEDRIAIGRLPEDEIQTAPPPAASAPRPTPVVRRPASPARTSNQTSPFRGTRRAT